MQNGFGIHLWLEEKGEGKFLRNRYEGEWLNGKRHGIGIFYYANGSKYEGEWSENYKDGFALFTQDSGDLQIGTFIKDKPLQMEISKNEAFLEQKELNINNSLEKSIEDLNINTNALEKIDESSLPKENSEINKNSKDKDSSKMISKQNSRMINESFDKKNSKIEKNLNNSIKKPKINMNESIKGDQENHSPK